MLRAIPQAYLYVGLNPINGVEKYLEHVDRKESVTLKDDDEERIRELIAQNKGRELDALVKLMAPSIIGEEHLKKGLLMAYINSGKDPVSKRRRLNSLLIGDPGLGKSKALRYMVKLGGGNSQFASAADSSAKSLIAVYDNDDKIIFMGAVPKAHGAICAID